MFSNERNEVLLIDQTSDFISSFVFYRLKQRNQRDVFC